jgi:hypothetical protein
MSEEQTSLTAGFEHLADNTTYRQIPHIQPKTIETRINQTWRTISEKHNFSLRTRKSFITNNSSIPKFYHLIKTHKSTTVLKVRPIISNVRGPTKKISWLLSNILKPLLSTVAAHLESSDTLIERLYYTDPNIIHNFPYPCSLDVVALYTSIPLQESIRNVIDIINSRGLENQPLDVHDIQGLLEVSLTNMYFEFENKLFLQIRGLAMGSCVSPIVAILFLDTIERIALTSNTLVGFYSRYVDDTLILTRNKESADAFHQHINILHPAIKFEIEYPEEDNSLSLLDFKLTIKRDNTLQFEHYKKIAKKELFVNFNSALPLEMKLNIIKNERERIKRKCSERESRIKHDMAFNKLLSGNQYPQEVIRQTYNSHRQRRQQTNTNESPFT